MSEPFYSFYRIIPTFQPMMVRGTAPWLCFYIACVAQLSNVSGWSWSALHQATRANRAVGAQNGRGDVSPRSRPIVLLTASTAALAFALTGAAPLPLQPVYAGDVPTLTSDDVLRSDVAPRIAILKDIQFTFKLYPQYIESRDYESFRGALRQAPSSSLRQTCLKLKPFLPEGSKADFEATYSRMIDAVNDMDTFALKRMQGENVPPVGQPDTQLVTLLAAATENLDKLISIAAR